jgi:hypothetical protein
MEQGRQQLRAKHPNEAIEYLRKAAKAQAALIPGSGYILDRAFDSINDIVHEHQAEASAVIMDSYNAIQAIQHDSTMENLDKSARVMEILGHCASELLRIGGKAGVKLVGPVWDKLDPESRLLIERRLTEMKTLAGSVSGASAEAGMRLYVETQKQVSVTSTSIFDILCIYLSLGGGYGEQGADARVVGESV